MLVKQFTGKTKLVAKRILFKQYMVLQAEVRITGYEDASHLDSSPKKVDEMYFEDISPADFIDMFQLPGEVKEEHF